jgi:hypothetical protein
MNVARRAEAAYENFVGQWGAMLLVGLVWLANQGVGFGVLHYPWTADCLAWGVGLGIVALLSAFGAEFGAKRFIALNGIVASTVAFLSAFGVYEGLLFIASMIFQSGVEDYAPSIVERIFAINTAAFIGLLLVNRLGVSAGFVLEKASACSDRKTQLTSKSHAFPREGEMNRSFMQLTTPYVRLGSCVTSIVG